MEKIKLNKDKCIGCGACNQIAQNNFGWEGMTATVIDDTITKEAKEAANCCPTGAITVEEEKEQ